MATSPSIRLIAASVLCQLAAFAQAPSVDAGKEEGKIPVLVISGANNHDWQWTTPSLARILEEAGRFDVDVTYEPAKDLSNAEAVSKYAAFVLDYNGEGWGDAAHAVFLEAVRGGTGVVAVHAADNSGRNWPEYERMIGDLWREGTGHGRFHAFDVDVVDRNHPVTRTMPNILMHPDELYHKLVNVHGVDRRVLASAFSDPKTGGTGNQEPMILTRSFGKGRVLHTPLGHVWKGNIPSQASHRDPQFRGLIIRGTEWAATGTVSDARRAPSPLTNEEKAAGWRSLMDPALWMSASGSDVPKGWRFGNGVIVRTAAAGDLVTRDLYGSFELTWQWKTTIASNSGLKYRIPAGTKPLVGPEYQMLDPWADEKSKEHRAGALYDVVEAGTESPFVPWGEFHEARIVADGTKLEHWLDGVLVMSADTLSDEWKAALADSKFKGRTGFAAPVPGHILLQDHGDEVWVRGLRIRRLPEPVAVPAVTIDDKPQPLFAPGDDLSNWFNIGDAPYRFEDGVLIGDAGPNRLQSFLVSKEEFGDFELDVDLKIAVLGNSGIQLRSHVNEGRMQGYQAEIDPTKRSWSAGIYEEGRRGWLNNLEDNEAARKAFKLQDWNHYRIVCEGPRIRTWVNGVPAADLLDGMDLSGSFGFQIHGGDDDIQMLWKNVRVMHTGEHSWVPAPQLDGRAIAFGADRVPPDKGRRVSIVGDDAKVFMPSAVGQAPSVKLADSKYWRKGGGNTLTILYAGERVVLQLDNRTIFDQVVPGIRGLGLTDVSSVSNWRVCK